MADLNDDILDDADFNIEGDDFNLEDEESLLAEEYDDVEINQSDFLDIVDSSKQPVNVSSGDAIDVINTNEAEEVISSSTSALRNDATGSLTIKSRVDSDEDEQSERGRFKSERKINVPSITSSTCVKKNIPETLDKVVVRNYNKGYQFRQQIMHPRKFFPRPGMRGGLFHRGGIHNMRMMGPHHGFPRPMMRIPPPYPPRFPPHQNQHGPIHPPFPPAHAPHPPPQQNQSQYYQNYSQTQSYSNNNNQQIYSQQTVPQQQQHHQPQQQQGRIHVNPHFKGPSQQYNNSTNNNYNSTNYNANQNQWNNNSSYQQQTQQQQQQQYWDQNYQSDQSAYNTTDSSYQQQYNDYDANYQQQGYTQQNWNSSNNYQNYGTGNNNYYQSPQPAAAASATAPSTRPYFQGNQQQFPQPNKVNVRPHFHQHRPRLMAPQQQQKVPINPKPSIKLRIGIKRDATTKLPAPIIKKTFRDIDKEKKMNFTKPLQQNLTNTHPDRTNLHTVQTVELSEEEDDDMKLYRKKIEEQKAIRAKILREKEQKRFAAVLKKEVNTQSTPVNQSPVNQSPVKPVSVEPQKIVQTNPATGSNSNQQDLISVRVKLKDGNIVIRKLTMAQISRMRKLSSGSGIKSRTVLISNLAVTTTRQQIISMGKQIGQLESLEMKAGERTAKLRFKTWEMADNFITKFRHKMVDLSMINVALVPDNTPTKPIHQPEQQQLKDDGRPK